MSRIGKKPILVPEGVIVEIGAAKVTATGPKGEESVQLLPGFKLEQQDQQIIISKTRKNPTTQTTYGLLRTLVDNAVIGVSAGFVRQLEINGVGYRASSQGDTITLSLGFSHPIVMTMPEGVEIKVEKNIITISGSNKQAVGQVAANIRGLKKPEPYKGKGIKYVEERIRRKAGKTAAKA